jgi:citrate lyase beta subunit
MKHHRYNPDFRFVKKPLEFNKDTNRNLLQYCLGATLYMPGTRDILQKILDRNLTGLTSMVMCFEDAIREDDLSRAEHNVLEHLEKISEALNKRAITLNDIPLFFVRVRNTLQFRNFANRLTSRHALALSGFVFPKFYSSNVNEYFDCLQALNHRLGSTIYGMPILEGSAIAFRETREEELSKLKRLLQPYKQSVLNIRVGGTDFSALFSVRRGMSYSIYDILTIRDCLSDIMNFFNRVDEDYTVSGPVWEYFLAYKKDNLDRFLTEDIHRSLFTRTPIVNEAIDGLLREVILDKANGFVGKTIIHPSHTRYVNAMQAVTKEEYEDATQILRTSGGVVKSAKSNKMNEINPHRGWAKKVICRAKAYGVIENEAAYPKLFSGKAGIS